MATQKKKKSTKLLWWIVGIVAVVIIIAVVFMPQSKVQPQMYSAHASEFDFDNQTFMLDNHVVAFTDGTYQNADGSHQARTADRYANPSTTKEAAVVIDQPGGSGVFYYIVGASKKDGIVSYATPILLGDRVKIESVKVTDDSVTVDYLDHAANSDFAAVPTEMKTVTYTFKDDGTLSQ